MSKGFFRGVSLHDSKPPAPRIAQCGACGLHATCLSPKIPVMGEGGRGILIVGESPSVTEDELGVPFKGESASVLVEEMKKHLPKFSLTRDCWRTNAVICRPPGKKGPTDNQVKYCQPNIIRAIKDLKPTVILLLGTAAVQSVIGHLWKDSPGGLSRWTGFNIPARSINSWVCSTWHPAYIARESRDRGLRLWFERHIESVCSLTNRPYEGRMGDTSEEIDVVSDPVDAARFIRQMISRGGAMAFDLETDRIKPDRKDSAIASCSICWKGKKTISFPWIGEVVDAMREFVTCEHPKIAANSKFEDRWIRKVLGVPVRNWAWDTMLVSHILDNRPSIGSVKFQAFQHLGEAVYNDKIEPFFNSDGPNEPNSIWKAPLHDLLLYNGLDALFEYRIAVEQMRQVGLDIGDLK